MKMILITALWCPSCLLMRPLYSELTKLYGITLEEVDYDENPLLINKYTVGKILPVAIFIHEEEPLFRIIGEKSRKQILQILKPYVEKTF